MPTISTFLNVWFIFDSCFACTCFGSSSIFAYSQKWIKESVLNFMWKPVLSARMHSECWLWHIWWSNLGPKQRLSVVQNFFRGPRRCERGRACRTPEHKVMKIVLVNHRITVREVAEDQWLVPFDFYQWFGHDTGRREIRTKIAKFRPKTASH